MSASELILELGKQVGETALSDKAKDDLMSTYRQMEAGCLDLREFVDAATAAIKAAGEQAPETLPTLLLIASELSKDYL